MEERNRMTNKLRELTPEECIEIRKTLLHEFHKYCEEHNLRYSLGYGTLLGAVRHGGMMISMLLYLVKTLSVLMNSIRGMIAEIDISLFLTKIIRR